MMKEASKRIQDGRETGWRRDFIFLLLAALRTDLKQQHCQSVVWRAVLCFLLFLCNRNILIKIMHYGFQKCGL